MDSNSLQHLPGAVYMQKLEQAARPQEPFAEFDVLTPDEPIPAWQFLKHVLNVSRSLLNRQVVQSSPTSFSTQIQHSDG